jgi:hypothetical protein
MSTAIDPLAGFKARLEAALLATLRDQTSEQGPERPSRLAPPRRRRGRRRMAFALAGLTALAIAAIALGPALLAPERPGQDAGEVAELAANPAARLLARAVPTVRGCVPAMPARVSGSPVVAVAGVVPPPPHHQVQREQQRKDDQQGHVQPPGTDRHRLG